MTIFGGIVLFVAGVVTGASAGSANITITVTDKTSVATMVGVTVTA